MAAEVWSVLIAVVGQGITIWVVLTAMRRRASSEGESHGKESATLRIGIEHLKEGVLRVESKVDRINGTVARHAEKLAAIDAHIMECPMHTRRMGS